VRWPPGVQADGSPKKRDAVGNGGGAGGFFAPRGALQSRRVGPGRCDPGPPQTRTCGITASGSSRRGFASATIRGTCVKIATGISVPAIFPSRGSTSRRLPFLRRVPRIGSPPSQVILRRYDSLTPVPPHFVAFAWRYRDLPHRFAPARGWDSYAHRPGLFSRSPRTATFSHGDVRASQVPG